MERIGTSHRKHNWRHEKDETADGRETYVSPQLFAADFVKSTSQASKWLVAEDNILIDTTTIITWWCFYCLGWQKNAVHGEKQRLGKTEPCLVIYQSMHLSAPTSHSCHEWTLFIFYVIILSYTIIALWEASKGELSRHVVARAVVLPRLKTAYSELPPMAARWKRAHTAMMIIEEIDEKITTCAAAEWQMNSHIRPNFTQHPTNRSWEESMGKCLYVPACLAHSHMHIHRHVHW